MRRIRFLAAVVAVLVVLGDLIFYDQPVGWAAGLYLLLLTGLLIARSPRPFMRTAPLALLVMVVGVGLAMVIEPGGLEIIFGGLLLGMVATVARSGWTPAVGQWATRGLQMVFIGWTRPIADWVRLRRLSQRRGTGGNGWATLIAWGLPVAVTGIFVGLFSMANPIVESWLDDAGAWLGELDEYLSPERIFFWLLIAWGIWTLARWRPVRTAIRWDRREQEALRHTTDQVTTTPVVLRALVLFNLVFAVQNGMDLAYLWRGLALPEGMTYAEYAHRGAYPLLLTALLAGALVLVIFRDDAPARDHAWAKRLVYLWLAQNIWLMGSTIRRLDLYVDVYALSRWRVAAMIWIGVVALGLALTLWRIAAGHPNRWLVRRCAVLGLAVVFVCCFINFDGLIARFNVRHCEEILGSAADRDELDIRYLEQLGPESIPALHWFADRPEVPADRAQAARRAVRRLHRNLALDLETWQGWTWRRVRLAATAASTRDTTSDSSATPAAEAKPEPSVKARR